ncbi:unnamed protein product, partial [Mesorhabditis belari]|uniref:Uncharacterized protein n=1 Tax=Mesorhabditis belari TaxID=2138241 RepID=A0AAF3EGH7_9BILA
MPLLPPNIQGKIGCTQGDKKGSSVEKNDNGMARRRSDDDITPKIIGRNIETGEKVFEAQGQAYGIVKGERVEERNVERFEH